jgi:hypothetical protein
MFFGELSANSLNMRRLSPPNAIFQYQLSTTLTDIADKEVSDKSDAPLFAVGPHKNQTEN